MAGLLIDPQTQETATASAASDDIILLLMNVSSTLDHSFVYVYRERERLGIYLIYTYIRFVLMIKFSLGPGQTHR